MKVSDYIADFLYDNGVRHSFSFQGGCIVHLMDSIARKDGMMNVGIQHEQAGAMAADGYSRITGNLGLAITTSGPGATNLLTGVCCSYYDSVPTIMITGQVPSSQLKRDSKSRQIGFQETDVVSIYKTVTKYASLVDNPENVRFELEKAVHIAKSGRPGPVLLDICDDVQRAQIDIGTKRGYVPETTNLNNDLEEKIESMYKMISEAQRPVIILGGGIRSGNSIEQAKYFVKKLGFPVLPTWGAMDYIPYSDSQIVGSFGVSSERAGNFAVQNSDLVIAIGTRLDTHEIGPKASTFARGAKKVVVDLDESEIDKYAKLGMNVDLSINSDVRDFFQYAKSGESNLSLRDIGEWKNKIREWKQKYPICLPEYRETKGFVNPYVFMDQLSKKSSDNEIVITDAGGNLTWTMQGFRVKGNQRLISAFNHSPMGYSLPASIGAAFASDRPISCIIGDGGLQINPQELATISYYGLPIKIFLINNQGHGIIKQTLDTWLESRYVCVDNKTGLPGPDLSAVANAYGIPSRKIRFNSELGKLEDIFREEGPLLVDVSLHPNQKIVPKLTFGRPIEDSEPLLSREEFKNNMIVPPIN